MRLAIFPFLLLLGCEQNDDTAAIAPRLAATSMAAATGTGINPCTGWAGGLFGAVASYTHDVNTVSFHGGTWTVPIALAAGKSLADVAFAIEAPSGNAGDPTSVRMGLYSGSNALAFTTLTPAGIGTRVAGDFALSPPRSIAPGEVLELEFAPLDGGGGGYAAHDTKIDAVQATSSRTITLLPALSYNPGTPSVWSPIDRWTDANGATMVSAASQLAQGSGRINIPHQDGDVITNLIVFVSGTGASGADFQVERFNVGIPGGFAALSPSPTVDNNRSNVWSQLPVSVDPIVLTSTDVVYLNMAPLPGAPTGYRVGGVAVSFSH